MYVNVFDLIAGTSMLRHHSPFFRGDRISKFSSRVRQQLELRVAYYGWQIGSYSF